MGSQESNNINAAILVFLSDKKYKRIDKNTGYKEEYTDDDIEEDKKKGKKEKQFAYYYNLSGRNLVDNFDETEDIEFIGTQTNEAPIKLLLRLAKQNEHNITKVICIVSKLAKDQGQVEWLEKILKEESSGEIRIKPIYYEEDRNHSGQGEGVSPNYSKIIAEISEHTSDIEKVYIDYTGGLRDISFLMTSIIRFLSFKGVECSEIVYSNHFLQPHRMFSLKYAYHMYRLINGAETFVNFGNANELSKAYREYEQLTTRDCEKETEKDDTGKLYRAVESMIKAMMDFSDNISINNIQLLDTNLKNIKENIDHFIELMKGIDAIRKEKHDDRAVFFFVAFKELINKIKEKFFLDDNTSSEGKSKMTDYTKLIKWCTQNGLIQQAMILYTEKMPLVYFEREDIIPKDIKADATENGKVDSVKAFYPNLYTNESFVNYDVKKVDVTVKEIEKETGGALSKSEKYLIHKCYQLEAACNHSKDENSYPEKLVAAMHYYFAIKQMRNRIAHADEKESSKVREYIEKFLSECRYKIDIGTMAMENCKKIMEQGLETLL